MGATARWNRRLAGLIAMVLVLLAQASTLSAAVRSCERTAAASARAVEQAHGGVAAERPTAPLPAVPIPAADASACGNAIGIVEPVIGPGTPTARVLAMRAAARTLRSDPFVPPVLRPPRA